MNPKEIAEAIDELIKLRINQSHNIPENISIGFSSSDETELLKRTIADGIMEYSGVKGVFAADTAQPPRTHPA